jgi:hypothetical protein
MKKGNPERYARLLLKLRLCMTSSSVVLVGNRQRAPLKDYADILYAFDLDNA